jgi:hypothetical protein
MKRFFLRGGVFFLIGALIFIILSFLSTTLDPQSDFRITQLLSKRNSINALAVGNSHTCAFDFDVLNMHGYRVAQGGNDVFEAEYQLRALVPLLPNLKIVFYNISYFSLFINNSAIPQDYCYFTKAEYKSFLSKYPYAKNLLKPIEYSNFFIINTKEINDQNKNQLGIAYDEIMNKVSDGLGLRKSYYYSIPSFTWVRGDFMNFIKSKSQLIIRGDHWKGVIYNLFRKKEIKDQNSYYRLDKYGQFTKELVYTYQRPDSLEILAREVQVPMYVNNVKIMSFFKKDIPNSTYNSLVSTIRFLRKRDIRLIFITTPVYKSFTRHYDKEAINLMKGKMLQLQKDYGVEYYDFSVDSVLSNNNEFFYNNDHLNKKGAEEFSKKLLPLINRSIAKMK